MCYAIPGKIIEVNGDSALIDYFGERKRAYVDIDGINPGDYAYAQGGVIVERLDKDIALSILNGWKEAFFKLKEIDRELAEEDHGSFSETSMPQKGAKTGKNTGQDIRPEFMEVIDKAENGLSITRTGILSLLTIKGEEELRLLYNAANRIRQKVHKNASCVHGIIEFSNICRNDCFYCGIRRENQRIERYRMDIDEIVQAAVSSANSPGFRAFVLQSGEDGYYTTERLIEIIRKIKERGNVLIFISIGERGKDCYQELYKAGARGVLFRFETSNPALYSRLHGTLYYEDRLRILRELKDIGYIIATGFLIGLPGQKEEDILDDILLASSIEPDMYSFGPFIPHPDTPLASASKIDIDMMLKVIAVTRLVHHDGNILVASALEKLFGIDGARRALMAGGNSMMVNLTPQRYRRLYSIYPGKGEGDDDVGKRIADTVTLLQSLGRAPMDIGIIRGSGTNKDKYTAAVNETSNIVEKPINRKLVPGEIIPSGEIEYILRKYQGAAQYDAESIIHKAESLKGLTPEEAAALLQCEDKDVTGLICTAAERVKESIYGKRLVLFAPLYLSNTCINNCLYCGFRQDNRGLERTVLTEDEIRSETEALIRDGHKRVLIVAGEEPKGCSIEYIERAIEIIYTTKVDNGKIRRVNVNVAPMSVEEFKRLKSAGIGTYQLFQESYHLPAYKYVHPSGPKSNYVYRITALDRAMEAGIDDVGMGVLFGLYDYKFEVLALIYHARHLENNFGIGPHTISIPRIEPASNAPLSSNPPYAVSDDDFMKLTAILRLAVPYTGIILSTRERSEFRNRLFHVGISQISANSKPYPGGYNKKDSEKGYSDEKGQFSIGDFRTTAEVIKAISKDGFSPSFCTACYRVGRTGREFMDFAKPGEIQRFCLPNSVLSLKEYLLDYGDPEVRKIGDEVIQKQTAQIEDIKIRSATIKKLEEIEKGKRDLYF